MKKNKFGVVSSFDTLCGNATYSEAIAKGLENDFDVLRVDVPINLQKNYDSALVKNMVKQVAECDHVNIQMELGLYGPTPSVSFKVLLRLMQACKRFSITMHRVEMSPVNLVRQSYNQAKNESILSIMGVWFNYAVHNEIYKSYKSIIDSAVDFGGSIVVHTAREANRVLNVNQNAKVYIYPILWPSESFSEVDLNERFENHYPIVGLFGFVSDYKNYEVVADGLLNKPFNIFIAGGTHPQAPFYGKKSDNEKPSYFRKISNLFSLPQYDGRVFIDASPTDDELIRYMKSVDVICVPYKETGQSGSGIASMAIQYGKRVVFSDTHCTKELVRFLNKRPVIFDVDSPLGLFCAISKVMNMSEPIQFDGYNFNELLRLYKDVS